jgi:hypothetical protein
METRDRLTFRERRDLSRLVKTVKRLTKEGDYDSAELGKVRFCYICLEYVYSGRRLPKRIRRKYEDYKSERDPN